MRARCPRHVDRAFGELSRAASCPETHEVRMLRTQRPRGVRFARLGVELAANFRDNRCG